MKLFFLCCLICLTAMADPFPPFESLKPPVLMPADAKLTVSKEGHFLVNGVPRYLEGVIYYEGNSAEVSKPTYGYPEDLKWLYESTQDYKELQRIGFDTVGTAAPNWWIDKYRPKKNYIRLGFNEQMLFRFAKSGLPVYVDFTCAGWHQGALKYKEGELPSEDAFTVKGIGNYHWMPYSVTTPEGKQLWREMWTYGARYFLNHGIKPMVYELFNEPDYNDWSEFNRKLFSDRMKEKYHGKLDELNRDWRTQYRSFEEIGQFKRQAENPALCIEWFKFMEDVFADICAEGVKAIREIDIRPEAGFCVQPLSLQGTNINLFKVNRHMNMICSGTGGGDLTHTYLLRALADGKPIFDGEAYMGKTRQSFRDKIWLQYARGFNATYIFKWCRRPGDKRWGMENGGKLLAEVFPYMMLNPYSVPTESLLGLMDAKKEISQVSDLFTPRDRGVKRQVAVLFSYPAQRLGRAAGSTSSNLVSSYTEALEYAHIPLDLILEEQLESGRQNRYPVIIVAGAETGMPGTLAKWEEYVKNGGILIFAQEAMQLNEYGFERENNQFPGINPGKDTRGESAVIKFNGGEFNAALAKEGAPDKSWKALASLGSKPVLFEKQLGKGKLIYLNAKMPGDSLAGMLTALLARENITPVCRTFDAAGNGELHDIEVVKAQRDGFTGYVLFNRSLAPKLVRFVPGERKIFLDIASGYIPECTDRGMILKLMPNQAVILAGADAAALEKRFGKRETRSYADLEKEGLAWLETYRSREVEKKQAFTVDQNLVKTVDLRSYANRDFVDRVAGDGKGGWTDQGANSLHNVPWGINDCNGVPFDFIRTDQNEERTCIVLGSKSSPELPLEVKGIKVESKAGRLFFLHAAAWSEPAGSVVAQYRINYADGSTADIPIRFNIETGDWFWSGKRLSSMEYVPGFINSEKRGLFVWSWQNPHPDKTIDTIDLISADTKVTQIVAGITLELPTANPDVTVPMAISKVSGWNKASAMFENGIVSTRFDEAKPWAGISAKFAEIQIPTDFTDAELHFDIAFEGKQVMPLQIKIGKSAKYYPFDSFTGAPDAEGWQKVAFSLIPVMADFRAGFDEFAIQMINRGEPRSNFRLRNLRLIQKRELDYLDPIRLKAGSWGGVKALLNSDMIELRLDDKSKSWSGVTLQISTPLKIPAGASTFKFEVNGGVDQWGKQDKGGQQFQVAFNRVNEAGEKLKSIYVTPADLTIDTDPQTWQTVTLPLDRLTTKDTVGITGISFQFKGLPAERSGIQLRKLRFE